MNNQLSSHDKELFAKFQQLIPSDSETLDFIHHHSWADACQNRTLKPFYLLRNTWQSKAFEFDNQEINLSFHLLKNANQDFLLAVAKYIGPHNDCPGWYSINYDDTNPTAKQSLAMETLDELSRKWYVAHEEFIEVFRSERARLEVPDSIIPQTPMVCDTRIVHSLSADVQEGWLGNFCDDEYTPIVRLATLSHRSLYHVLAWEKTKEFQDGDSRKYELTLFVAKDNICAIQTYTSQSKIYLVRINYSLGILKDIAIHKIFTNKIVGNLICGKDKEEAETECKTIKDVEIRETTLAERNRLKAWFPQLFAEDFTQKVSSAKQPVKAGQSSTQAALCESPFSGLENSTCAVCGWIHTTDCSRWEHPNTHEVVTTSKKRAKLLFKLHSGMEKDCGDTAIDNFIEDEDRKAGYQAGDILGDNLQTLLYFSTKRGRGRIRKPDEKAPQGRPSKKKK